MGMFQTKSGEPHNKPKRGYTVVHPNTKEESRPFKTYKDARGYAMRVSALNNKGVEIRRYPNQYSKKKVVSYI